MTRELTKEEKNFIKGVVKLDAWKHVMTFVGLKIEQWNEQRIEGSNAFEELRALHRRDGGIEKVNELFDQLERQALE
jgi:hypothetical protein